MAVVLLLVLATSLAPEADARDHPLLSEEEAIKLALADERVQAELSEHGPYRTDAKYEDGVWTVHFFVEESGLVGGKPTGDGRKEVARVGVNDTSWVLNYVWVGDRSEERRVGKE